MTVLYEVAGRVFRTKSQLEDATRAIVNGYEFGETVEGYNLTFLLDLFRRHKHHARKAGAGIASVSVHVNREWKTQRMLVINRTDGTSTDISWRECIYPVSAKQEFKKACRSAVAADVLCFKRMEFGESDTVPCAITGDLVSWRDSHVDHECPAFDAIVDEFVREFRLVPDAVALAGDGDNERVTVFADAKLADRFRVFHNARAKLRIVSQRANLTRTRQ